MTTPRGETGQTSPLWGMTTTVEWKEGNTMPHHDRRNQRTPTFARMTPTLARIRQQVLASEPPGPRVCVLCHSADTDFVGSGIVDGIAIGYALCQSCFTPAYIERITAKVRGEMFLRRRN